MANKRHMRSLGDRTKALCGADYIKRQEFRIPVEDACLKCNEEWLKILRKSVRSQTKRIREIRKLQEAVDEV